MPSSKDMQTFHHAEYTVPCRCEGRWLPARILLVCLYILFTANETFLSALHRYTARR